MVDAVQDVRGAAHYEGPGGLMPARIVRQAPVAAVDVVGACRAPGRQEADDRYQ